MRENNAADYICTLYRDVRCLRVASDAISRQSLQLHPILAAVAAAVSDVFMRYDCNDHAIIGLVVVGESVSSRML